MVKLGNNFSEKSGGKAVSEDGFDTIPLITPLDASQLQFPPPEKVAVAKAFVSFIFSHFFFSSNNENQCSSPPVLLISNPWTDFSPFLPGGGEDKGGL